MNKALNAVCAFLAVFALGYVLLTLIPLLGYAVLVVGAMYGYAWLNRKVGG